MLQQSSSNGTGSRPVQRAFDPASKLFAIVLGIIAVIAGVGMGLWNPFLSHSASTQGTEIDTLFSLALGVGTTIFVIVQGALIYSIVRFSQQPGDESDGLPIRGNTPLEILWTAIPAGIVVFLAVYSYQILYAIEKPQPDALTVEVKAQQYAWQFYYPDQDVTANELHIPLDRQVHLKMRSTDVIHSFWVPQFRIKKDVMPDRVTETFITATELGTYPIVCAELCGAAHALMRSQVVVQSDADFKNWLASNAGAKEAPLQEPSAQGAIAQGRQLFNQYGCNACHTLRDANAVGQLGPNLDGIGSRAGTTVPEQSAEEYVHTSIVKPNAYVVKGYQAVMPQDYGNKIPEADLNLLVQYLLGQK